MSFRIRICKKTSCFPILCVILLWSFLVLAMMHYNLTAFNQRAPPVFFLDEEHLLVEDRKLSEDEMIEEIGKAHPNLPISFWDKHKKYWLQVNKTCARFPDVIDLEYNNGDWQTLRTTDGTFQLFGAYLDVRPKSTTGPAVRILGMIDRVDLKVPTHCQLWFESEVKPVLVATAEYKLIWNTKWGNKESGIYQPYLIACVLPKTHAQKVPEVVSLVERPCDRSSNSLKVIYNKPAHKRKDFAVCVKGLNYPHTDLSVKLIEWIELLRIVGAEKVFLYKLEVHPNITKVLRYYEDQGVVQVTPISLAGAQPNAPGVRYMYLEEKVIHKRQNELIPYNDCFYKHMYEYKYIVLLDIDEVIVPKAVDSWKELMKIALAKSQEAKKQEKASFNVRNAYFLDDLLHRDRWFDDIPKYMHMLQHVYRTDYTKAGSYIKCFHNTDLVVALHNHFPIACFGGKCLSYSIETSDAQLQHYRTDCLNELWLSCEEMRERNVLDTTIWKYKEQLMTRVTTTLRMTGFLVTKRTSAVQLEDGGRRLKK